MKNKLMALLIVPVMLLSSCDSSIFRTSSIKEINVYNLDSIKDEDDISRAESTSIKARFVSGREYIPYLTLKQYASLYESHFSNDVISQVSKNGTSVGWTIYRGDQLYFISEISFINQEVAIGGNLEATFKDGDNPQDIEALSYGMYSHYESIETDNYNSYTTFSFREIKLDYFTYGGEYYFPLSFFDITYSYESSIYFFYNYHAIYSTYNSDAFDEKTFKRDGVKRTVNSEMEATNVDLVMPSYLREYNANMFFYLMNNCYGFKDYITDFSRSMLNPKPSMAQFCKNKGLYNDLFSVNPSTRSQAYSDALSYLDDNHTAVVSANKTWGEDSFSRFRYAPGCIARSQLRQNLTNGRNSQYDGKGTPGKDIIYSSDGKTAMYMFDEFYFGKKEEVFNEDGTVNIESAVKVDTYFNLIETFKKIKEHGGVENVVLDIATNGGGVLGVMMKILALISESNSSTIYYVDLPTGQGAKSTTKVDIDGDRDCDTEDCFGDDFNFYILTSDCSFSCANAFPCFAQYDGSAKVIGEKSGGGECAVAVHFLPNSQYVYHSSNLHLGYFDSSDYSFLGFESGAEPDIALDKGISCFDIEYLNASIARYQNETN